MLHFQPDLLTLLVHRRSSPIFDRVLIAQCCFCIRLFVFRFVFAMALSGVFFYQTYEFEYLFWDILHLFYKQNMNLSLIFYVNTNDTKVFTIWAGDEASSSNCIDLLVVICNYRYQAYNYVRILCIDMIYICFHFAISLMFHRNSKLPVLIFAESLERFRYTFGRPI